MNETKKHLHNYTGIIDSPIPELIKRVEELEKKVAALEKKTELTLSHDFLRVE